MTGRAELDGMLVSYVDGELDEQAAAEVERLAATDPRVSADIEMFRATAMLLRAACGEQHYRAAPAPERRTTPAPHRRARWGWAVAAGVLLALGGFGGGAWWDDTARHSVLDEVAEYHRVIQHETVHLAELPPERADELRDWLGDRLGRRLAIPDLGRAGLTFAGGRMLVLDGAAFADFLYTRGHGAPVAVCVIRGALAAAAVRLDERDGLRLASWSRGGYTFVVVGDLDADTVRHVADLVAAQIDG